MNTRVLHVPMFALICLTLHAANLNAAPITDFAYFDDIEHTEITFELDGAGNTIPVISNVTLAATEYAAQGVTILPNTRLARDSNSCFRFLQNINGSTPYGLIASDTDALEFDPPISAFAVSFVDILARNASFTALDGDGNIIETAVFAGPFIDGDGCSFLEFGVIGISSTTPIARVEIIAISGSIDNLRYAGGDADGDGVPDGNDNCPDTPNADQADGDSDGIGDVCDDCPNDSDNDADGDGVCGDVDNCPTVANADQTDSDGDTLGDACDDDDDNDGLSDVDEAAFGTDPFNSDTDGDGLLDGTEVDMAMGSGCPDPLNADSDGDTLSDGSESLTLGTSTCNADTDGDGVDDASDPLPLESGVTSGFLETAARSMSTEILALDLSLLNGPNNNADMGRRNALANRATEAANLIVDGDFEGAAADLNSLLQKIDDLNPSPDWMDPSPEKTDLADQVALLLLLIDLSA